MRSTTTSERRIYQLEKILRREIESNRNGHKSYKIGYTQFELSQLYKLSGISDKSKEKLKEALETLHSPECKRTKKAVKLLDVVSFYLNNPSALPLVQLPRALRYLSPMILLAGYVGAYAMYFLGLLSYSTFFISVFLVFVASIVASSLLTNSYTKRIVGEYAYSNHQISGVSGASAIKSERTPDDILDDARAELSLANMFHSMKNDEEMEAHIERARAFLKDPMSDLSKKKQQAMDDLSKMETWKKGARRKERKERFPIF